MSHLSQWKVRSVSAVTTATTTAAASDMLCYCILHGMRSLLQGLPQGAC